jgi:hypothetical protein
MQIKKIVLLGMLLVLSAKGYADNITIVAHTNETDEIVRVVPKKLIKKKTSKMIMMMSEAGLTGLEKASTNKKGNWQLNAIEIGPGIAVSGGIGPWQIGGIAGFKLVFERQE